MEEQEREAALQTAKDSVHLIAPGVEAMLNWLKSSEGLDKMVEHSFLPGQQVTPYAPLASLLTEIFDIANQNGVNVKTLVQNSLIRFCAQEGWSEGISEEIRPLIEDVL